jgi:sugar lactone lactonase YvrE
VFRLVLDPDIPLPRRLDRVAPLFPRAWGGAKGGAMLPRLISVAATTEGDVALLSSSGQVFRLSSDGALHSVARLPLGFGQYNRTNMVGAPGGGVFVSGGFHIGRIFYVSPEGVVTTVASGLADPEGIALDRTGQLYVAESSFHRVVRFRPSLP